MPTIVASGATPTMPMPLLRRGNRRGHMGAMTLKILHGGLVRAVAVGDFLRIGSGRRTSR